MIEVKGILIREEIFQTRFVCDLNKCKGACCTLDSQFGAPLNRSELQVIAEVLSRVLDYLPEEHKDKILKEGFYDDYEGEYLTKTIDNKACVFVYYDENKIAKCSFEKAYFDGKIEFRKPISCHLFPIRVARFGGDILRYERFKECEPALEKGKSDGNTIFEFCKDALIRAYGKEWYESVENFVGGKKYVDD
jgi:hypothetical protein